MDSSVLDQFVSGLAATLIGGAILLSLGYAAIERRLATKARRHALRVTHGELRSMEEDITVTAAATRRFWGPRPAVRDLESRYDHEVADLKKNMLDRFPGFSNALHRAIRAVETERDYRARS
jgi:hypothetical protein